MALVRPQNNSSIYKVILALGFAIPLIIAGLVGNYISSEILITVFVVFTVFMISFFSYWILMKAIFQIMEKAKKSGVKQ